MDNRPDVSGRAALAVLAFAMFLVASCAPIVPSATVPRDAESSPTPLSTETPTTLPNATATSTIETPPTVDPNAPPDGTGQKDANGNYTKIENGVSVVWNPELQTYERHLNLNDQDIPLIVWNPFQHNLGIHDQVFLTVRISDKVQGFEKAGSIRLHPGANIDNEPGGHPLNFSNLFLGDVIKKYTGSFNRIEPGWFDGKISFTFTTSERPDPWVWTLGPHTKVIVDVLDKSIGNGFQKADDPWAKGSLQKGSLQVRLFTDEGGNLHLWIVPGSPLDQLTKKQLMEIMLYAPAQVIDHSDQRVPPFSPKLDNYISFTTNPNLPPFFDFGPPQ
jgi:hypothetical protein